MPGFFKSTVLLCALATSVVTMQSSPANAKVNQWGEIKDFSFEIDRSYLADPIAFVFEPNKKGKYEFKELDGGMVKLRLKAEAGWRSWIDEYQISLGLKSDAILLDSNGFEKGNWKKLDKQVSFRPTRELLKVYEPWALKHCKENGKPNEKVLGELEIPFSGWAHASGKRKVTFDGDGIRQTMKWVKKYQARIVCLPVPFKVESAKLSVQYHSNPNRCPVKVTLKADFEANKPGDFSFRLFRGDGEFQDVAKTIGKSGKVSFHKDYTFSSSTDRKYKIAVMGDGFASSDWVPVKVNCGSSGGGGGFAPVPKKNGNY